MENIERHILSSIIFNSSECSYAFENLKPEYFKNFEYREFFKHLKTMETEGKPIDIISIDYTSNFGDLAMELATTSFTTANIRYHSDLLIDNWYKSNAKESLKKLLLNFDDYDIIKIREILEESISSLSDRTEEKGLASLSKIAETTLSEIDKISKGIPTGMSFGFKSFDERMIFLEKKKLILLAARPGMGKSSLALKIAKNNENAVIAYFSPEMSKEEHYERLMAIDMNIPTVSFKMKETIDVLQDKIINSCAKINEQKILINDDTKITTSKIKNQSKRLKKLMGLDLIIIDYLQLITPNDSRLNRNQQIAQISSDLVGIAKTLDVPVIALSQLNRDCEERKDKRPLLSDLKESGSLEQDANMVLFIYRGSVYDQDNPSKDAEIIIAKHRSGPTGLFKLKFQEESTNFIDPSEESIDFKREDWID